MDSDELLRLYNGTPITFTSKKGQYAEMPDVTFSITEEGRAYFNAMEIIRNSGRKDVSIRGFVLAYGYMIRQLMDVYEISKEDAVRIEENGDIQIEGELINLFLSYVQPSFLPWADSRITELLTTGCTVSDRLLDTFVQYRNLLDIGDADGDSEQS